jgi:hypothetical protein
MISAKFEWWFKHSGESIVNADRRTGASRRKNVVIPAVWKFVDEAFTVAVGTALTIDRGTLRARSVKPRAGPVRPAARLNLGWSSPGTLGLASEGDTQACKTGAIDHGGGMAAVARLGKKLRASARCPGKEPRCEVSPRVRLG